MFDAKLIPERILNRIMGLSWNRDDTGMSGSTIMIFDEIVLKIEKISRSSENEIKLLNWLDRKLPAPKIIEHETRDDYSFLLMTRLSGNMACSDNSLQNMADTVKALAKGLQMLWQLDTSTCPCTDIISDKLVQAKYSIENNLVDVDNFNPETFGTEGFIGIPDLYNFFDRHRPKEDFVFSHGDFCLPNIFISGSAITGFLDWGNGGIADRWQDIALCVRSLQYNHMEYAGYGEDEYLTYRKMLFQELGIEPDEEKIRYYILLDELF